MPYQALRDIDLAIERGEFVCFLGPSGCGKTTLLRIVAGLEAQTSGRVHQGGRDVARLPPAERDYGIVLQSHALFPNLSVAANVAYGLVNRREPKAKIAARVEELVGLPGSGAKFPAQLSGGQQQRIALARALATRPWAKARSPSTSRSTTWPSSGSRWVAGCRAGCCCGCRRSGCGCSSQGRRGPPGQPWMRMPTRAAASARAASRVASDDRSARHRSM